MEIDFSHFTGRESHYCGDVRKRKKERKKTKGEKKENKK